MRLEQNLASRHTPPGGSQDQARLRARSGKRPALHCVLPSVRMREGSAAAEAPNGGPVVVLLASRVCSPGGEETAWARMRTTPIKHGYSFDPYYTSLVPRPFVKYKRTRQRMRVCRENASPGPRNFC